MALEGKLSDFNLAEILQLISSQQKSGFLNLESSRNMVFVFDNGLLVATRDRRIDKRDPLESFLKAYGFFNEEQWMHVEFVSRNSSLDLTEILVSENLFTEEKLKKVLKSLAQEMTTMGMKLRQGSYHFRASKESPSGVFSRIKIDIQGLLMESARRLDEGKMLREALPSPNITFSQGEKVIPEDGLCETGQHVFSLALAGIPLGRIIRQGRAGSFVVRTLLKTWCEEDYLLAENNNEEKETPELKSASQNKNTRGLGLRRAPVLAMVLILVLGLGWLRWSTIPLADTKVADRIRQSQLRHEIQTASTLFRYREGHWPDNLQLLVERGLLADHAAKLSGELKWEYVLDKKNDRYEISQH